MQYLPYKGDVSYLNMVIGGHFEKLGKKDVWRLLDAHGIRQIPVGFLDHLNEHAFNDRAMSKTFAV